MIPKKLRELAGLTPGMELEVSCHDGRIEVEPAEAKVHLEDRDGFLVVVFDEPGPPITNEMVNEWIDQSRSERGRIDAEAGLK